MKITISNPCSEDWTQMTNTDKGRFCASCQKCVVDFTTMTDVEIVRYLTQQNGQTCGRFRKEQLNRSLKPPQMPLNRWTKPFAKWVLASAMSLSIWSPKMGFAAVPMVQTQRSVAVFEKEKKIQSVDNEILKDSTIIKGTVIDVIDKQGIIGCNIVIKGSTIGVVTDTGGHFVLNIPVDYQQKTFTLVVSSIGYETHEIIVEPQSVHPYYSIKITMSEMVLGGIMDCVKPTLWQRIKHVFRKKNN